MCSLNAEGRQKLSEAYPGFWLKTVKTYVVLGGKAQGENCPARNKLTQVESLRNRGRRGDNRKSSYGLLMCTESLMERGTPISYSRAQGQNVLF